MPGNARTLAEQKVRLARSFTVFFLPLPAILGGGWIAEAHGVSKSAYLPNLIALVLGGVFFVLLRRASLETLAARLPTIAAILVLATLFAPGLEGVHRWLPLGPLRLHASSAFVPWVLVGLLSTSRTTLRRTWVLLATIQAIHVLQPDAGQASALAAGAAPLLLSSRRKNPGAVLVALVLVSLAAVTWLRRDPLPPVDHVERILFLAFAKGTLGVAMVVLGASALLVPFVRRTSSREARVALVLYLVAAFFVTFFGNFPVPVFGAGAGAVLGWCALLSVHRARQSRAD